MIDKRKRYGLMLDTETANNIDYPFFYDLGFAVIDTKGNVYETFSFVNSDIFQKESDLMDTCYYAQKIPKYVKALKNGERIMGTTYEIKSFIQNICKKYDCKFICAHNALFDLKACNNTQRWTTKSKYRYFFPYGVEIWDTLKMARQVIAPMPTYQKYCQNNGYLTKYGKPRLTAEIIYRFITGNDNFEEEHQGLDDVLIEVEILKYCQNKHQKMTKNLFEKI